MFNYFYIVRDRTASLSLVFNSYENAPFFPILSNLELAAKSYLAYSFQTMLVCVACVLKSVLQVKGWVAGTTHWRTQTRGRYSKHLRKANGSTARVCVCLSLSMPVAAQRPPLCFQACWIHFLKQCPNTIHASIHPSSFSRQPTDSGPTSHLWTEKRGKMPAGATRARTAPFISPSGFTCMHAPLCTFVIVITWRLIFGGYSLLGSRGPSTVTFMARW